MGFQKFVLNESAVKNEAKAIADRSASLLSRITGKPIMNLGSTAVVVDGKKYKGLQFIVGKEWSIVIAINESGASYVFVYNGARITNLRLPKFTVRTEGMNLFTFIRTCKGLIEDLTSEGTITGALTSGTVDFYVDTKEEDIKAESVMTEAISFEFDGKYFGTKTAACEYLLSKGLKPSEIAFKLDMKLPNISVIKKNMESGRTDLKSVKVSSQVDSPKVYATSTPEQEVVGNKIESDEVKVDRLYKKMNMYIASVLDKKLPSLIISGDSGIGKSHTLNELMSARGMTPARIVPVEPPVTDNEDIDGEDESAFDKEPESPQAKKRGRPKKEVEPTEEIPASFEVKGDYVKYTGKMTVAGLYRALCKFRHKLIILDDCDSIWELADGVNILKGALDSKARREISYPVAGAVDVDPDNDAEIQRVLADGKVPTQIVFDGQMIFITNLPLKEIDSAILSRIFYVNVRLSGNQVLMRIKQRYNELPNGIPDSGSPKAQLMALEFFDELFEKNANWQPSAEKFNFRTFTKASQFIDVYNDQFGGSGWEEMLMDDLSGSFGD